MMSEEETIEIIRHIYKLKIENESEDLMRRYVNSIKHLHKDVIIGIERLIKSSHDMKYAASKVYFELDVSSAARFITPFVDGGDKTFRQHLCILMGQYRNNLFVELLAERLMNDPEEEVRYEAAVSLIKIGDENALPALKYASSHDQGTDFEGRRIDEAALEAIKKIKSRSM